MGNDGLAGCKNYDHPDQELIDTLDIDPSKPARANSRSVFVRRRRPSKMKPGTVLVYLNVYHLNDSWESSNKLSGHMLGIGGAFHVGLEVHGVEWSYGTEGITQGIPKEHDYHVYHKSVLMGECDRNADEVLMICDELSSFGSWRGEDYDLLEHNCCNFSDTLSQALVGEPIPDWVLRFPRIASAASAHLSDFVDLKRVVQGDDVDSLATPRNCAIGIDATPMSSVYGDYTPLATPCGLRCSPFGV